MIPEGPQGITEFLNILYMRWILLQTLQNVKQNFLLHCINRRYNFTYYKLRSAFVLKTLQRINYRESIRVCISPNMT